MLINWNPVRIQSENFNMNSVCNLSQFKTSKFLIEFHSALSYSIRRQPEKFSIIAWYKTIEIQYKSIRDFQVFGRILFRGNLKKVFDITRCKRIVIQLHWIREFWLELIRT